MVHDVLVAAGKIEQPWLPGAAEKCRWGAARDWLYAVNFTTRVGRGESRLRFAGFDTIVDVYLNGERVASHENMFTPLAVNVSGRLRRSNTLVLHFHSVFDLSGSKPVPLRIVNGDSARRVRRPNHNYEAYLGPHPYFSRVGVYDAVILEHNNGSVLEEVLPEANLDDAMTQGAVTINITGRSQSPSVEIRARVPAPVHNGAFTAQPALWVPKPQLWWPRGYGAQPLYRFEVTLSAGGAVQHTERRTLGFRRITMLSLLHFVVNGVPVRLWGGCWVAPRWDTAVWDPPRVAQLFRMAENAHFNVFRVWAQTESPRDDFYEMADARGFLLWQDFTLLPLGEDEVSRADPREGNTHGYTNIWFVPGFDYLNFAAEDTRIAAPVLHSLRRFMKVEDLWPAGYTTLYLPGERYPYPNTWLAYTASESWKKTGPVEQFYDAADAAGLVYRLGMAESLYYRDTIERQRRGRDATDPSDRRRSGGYIVWKFNDSWPEIYGGKVDYFLEPYRAYYAIRRAYQPVLLSFDIGTYIYVWVVNERPVNVPPGKSVVAVRLDEAGIGAFRRERILFASLAGADGKVIARADTLVDIERRVGSWATIPTAGSPRNRGTRRRALP